MFKGLTLGAVVVLASIGSAATSAATVQAQTTPVISECRSAFRRGRSEELCVGYAVRYNMERSQITQCTTSFRGDSEELDCIRFAGMGPVKASGIVACDAVFTRDNDALRCLENAALADGEGVSSAAIYACGDGMRTRANELACIELVGQYVLGSQVVDYCLSEAAGDSRELDCLRRIGATYEDDDDHPASSRW